MQLPGLTIGIIADDLTGACDTGLQFFKAGCVSRVLLNAQPRNADETEESQVWSVNAETRHLEPRHAIAQVRECAALLRDDYKVDHFYKKMDSTLRGHFADECLAVLDEMGWDCAVIAPAYPQEGRRTVGGYQLVHGTPVEQTEVARDPLFPVRQSHVPTMVAEASKPDIVGHIALSSVLRGAGPLLSELTELINDGKKLVVVDACSQTDLEQIALAIEKIQKTKKVLPCGSAGLAQAFSLYWPSSPDGEQAEEQKLMLPSGPVLMIVGTNSSLNRTQTQQLVNNYSYYTQGSQLHVLEVTPEHVLGMTPMDGLVEKALSGLQASHTVLLSAAPSDDSVGKTLLLAEEQGIAEVDVPERVQKALTGLAQQLYTQIAGIKWVICGGETATELCRELDTGALKIEAEIEPSIPLLTASPSAQHTPFWLVTKSGNFGSELALANIVRYLKSHETSVVDT